MSPPFAGREQQRAVGRFRSKRPSFVLPTVRRQVWLTLLELALLAAWAMMVGEPYLNPNPHFAPMGREVGIQLNTHFMWTAFQRCGLCALWDGTLNGGNPALANPFGGQLNPIVAVATLLGGVINGAKIALIICFWLAGVAQWWMARALKLGAAARLVTGAMAVAGGHLAARMATGQFTVILSVAMCSLALAAAFHLAVSARWRGAAVLGVLGGLAIMSGHGYVQLGLLSWTPAFLFFVIDRGPRLRPVWRKFALAVLLAILIAGVFLVPVLHFLPNYAKDNDIEFKRAQPIEYAPLNLVIRDYDFLRADVLGKFDAPELFGMYIGWVPVILAAFTLKFARRPDYRALLALMTGVVMSFVMGSAILLKFLVPVLPFLSGFRHPSLSSLLAVPGVLALAAYGLDGMWKLSWPHIKIVLGNRTPERAVRLSTALILLVPLTASLGTEFEFTRYFIGVDDNEEIYQFYDQVIGTLQADGVQWINPPIGEHYLVEPALEHGLKLTEVSFPEHWADRDQPDPKIVISRTGEYPGADIVGHLNDLPIYRYPDRSYAYVEHGDGRTPCRASGYGGDLAVTCSTDRPGQLVVMEYTLSGWWASRDGAGVDLLPGWWLSTDAPAGTHTYEFHYRPWDVPIGLIISLIGLALTVWLWLRAPDRRGPPTDSFEI